jgi:hypothetical protein
MERHDPPGKKGDTSQPAAAAADGLTLERAPDATTIGRLTRPARRALGAIVTGAESAAEPIVGRMSNVIEGAGQRWHERPGARVRRVRRLGSMPLPFLMDVHPGARAARPVQAGLRSIEVDEIAGTAVGGGDQRGGDFLPLRQFRGKNWLGRWQRLRAAHERLATLPPIDVVKFADRYWVADGHNRVALALYGGQISIDANIVELVPPGERRSEPIVSLAPSAADSITLRAAGSGQRAGESLLSEGVIDSHELAGAPQDQPE